MSKYRRVLGVLLLFAVGSGAALLLGEVAARLLGYHPLVTIPRYLFDNDAATGWTPRPGFHELAHQPDGDVTYTISSQGLRGAREFGPKDPARLRVFLLGDSFTFGWAAKEEDTAAVLLEGALAKRGVAAEVANLGVPGFGTRQVEGRLHETVERIGVPDVAIYLFCPNDPVDNLAGRKVVVDGIRIDADRRGKQLLVLVARAYKHSRLLAWCLDLLYTRNVDPRAAKAAELAKPSEPSQPGTPDASIATRADFVATAESLTRMLDWAAEHHVRFVVMTTSESEYSPALKALLAPRGIPFLDFEDAMREYGQQAAPLWLPVDGHWNRAGNALVARALADRLTR